MLALSQEYMVSINNALASIIMKEKGIQAIYTFDRHFKTFKDIEIISLKR